MSAELGPLCPFQDCLEAVFIMDEATGEGWCPNHFELVLERWEAIAANPSMRETLPALYDQR